MNRVQAEPMLRPAAGAAGPQGLEHLRYCVAVADAGSVLSLVDHEVSRTRQAAASSLLNTPRPTLHWSG